MKFESFEIEILVSMEVKSFFKFRCWTLAV